ncbi:MAG: CotH kinase family protein [Candidatus Omnitrophota bacterium]
MARKGFLFIAFFMAANSSLYGQVVINEIMYNASVSPLEYVELFNPTHETIDLSGWTLKDNLDSHQFVIPFGTFILANSYAVISNDSEDFYQTYGFLPAAGGLTFNFANGGDSVRFYDAQNRLIEAVEYDDRSPWPEMADGGGASLERRNALLPPGLPIAWAASVEMGTPGAANSAHIDKLPPVIFALDHSPKIPAPNQSVTVTAQMIDLDGTIASAALYYGWNNGTVYQKAAMADDGQHGDGEAGDGIYGAKTPGASAGSILRFYIEAKDDGGSASLFPEAGKDQPYLTVYENALPNERVSILRLAMRPEVNQQFLAQYQTDVYFPATFYDGDQVYYNVQVRHRGRSRVQNGRFKIRFSPSQLYRGKIRRLNFNGTDASTILREYLSYQLYQDAGLPNLESELVRLHINGKAGAGTPYRVAIENPDGQFLKRRQYFQRDDGNLYKTTLDGTPQNKATWRYIGDDPDLYRHCYIKQTNEEEDDFSDIIQFCKALSQANPWDPDYLDKVYSVLNADNFILWMAVSACVAHWDSPYTDHGQNYVLYDNPATRQFEVIAWDLNGTFNYTSNLNDLNYRKLYTHIRSTKFPTINMMLNHPLLGSQYYREIDRLMNTLFSQESMNQRIEAARQALQLNASSVSFLKTYVAQRLKDLSAWINRDQGIAFISKPVYQAIIGEPYLYRCVAVDYRQNQAIAYSLADAPSWLSVDSQTGELRGVPAQEGRFDVVLEAQSKKGVRITQAFSLQIVDSKPKLILTFNEAGAAAMDSSGYARQGQLRGAAKRVDGRLGQAVSLSGNSYVEFPHDDSLHLTGSVTVEAWISPNVITTGNPVILTKGDADQFNYNLLLGYGPFTWDVMEPGFMPHRFDIENRVYYGRKEIEAQLKRNQWIHLAGTYDSGEELVCVYANNRRIVESSCRARMVENQRSLFIGLNSNGFQGLVDDVKILPFAKQAFAAGLCLSQVDVSGLSPAQERVTLSLSRYQTTAIHTEEYCLYLVNANRWLALPPGSLAPGKTISWWLDDLGIEEPLPEREILALYPIASLGQPRREFILDQVAWGEAAPDESDPGAQAAVWLPGHSVKITQERPASLSLKNFADNDEMDLDWIVSPQMLDGPAITQFTIENGAATAKQRDIHLQIMAQNAASSWKMRLANTPAMGGAWIPFSANAEWSLPPGEGEKTVYLQIADAAGRRSPVSSAKIRLEAGTPVADWFFQE